MHSDKSPRTILRVVSVLVCTGLLVVAQQADFQMPSTPLSFGAFTARFDTGGTFTMEGKGWPKLSGNWKTSGSEIQLTMSGGPGGCDQPGRYKLSKNNNSLTFDLVADECKPRQMSLDRSTWRPAGEKVAKPERQIKATTAKTLRNS